MNKTKASTVICILLFIPIEADLSIRKMYWYFDSSSFGMSCSSSGEPSVTAKLSFSAYFVKVGTKEAMTATWSGYFSDF